MFENIPKKLIGGIVIAAVVGVGAYLWLGTSEPTSDSLQASGTAAEAEVQTDNGINTEEILLQLNQLRRISMDTEIFNSPSFLSLDDFSVTISEQPIGRENPFIPSTYVVEGAVIIPNDPVNQQPLDQDDVSDDAQSATDTDTELDTTENEAATSTQDTDSATSSEANEDTSESGTEEADESAAADDEVVE